MEAETDDARDDEILQKRLTGRSVRSIARQLNITNGAVDDALDRVLPELNNKARLRAIGLDLHRLDGLLETFYKRAIEEHDAQAGLLCVKILERRSLILGLDTPARIDPIQVQIAATTAASSSVDRIRAALDRVRQGSINNDSEPNEPALPPH